MVTGTRFTLAKVTFNLFLCKIQSTVNVRIPNMSRDETTRVVSPGQNNPWGNPGKQDNFSSYKRFGSPNRDSLYKL